MIPPKKRDEARAGRGTKEGGRRGAVAPRTFTDRKSNSEMVLADSERTFKVVERALRELWDVVDELARILPTQPEYYRVTIFGSSRMNAGDPLYADVRRLAKELAGMGCDIVTGGGPGLMQAANEGERLGDTLQRTRSYGLNVELPHEQMPNPFVEKLYHHKTFFSRLHHFVRLSSAFVVVQGGIGTSLETMLVWQLCQVRHVHDRPLVLVGQMWRGLVAWAREYMVESGQRLADPEDLQIPICVDTVDEAVEVVRKDLERWNAARAGKTP
ncbi:MAG: LOG family protein [Gemmatimonadota bacterium]